MLPAFFLSVPPPSLFLNSGALNQNRGLVGAVSEIQSARKSTLKGKGCEALVGEWVEMRTEWTFGDWSLAESRRWKHEEGYGWPGGDWLESWPWLLYREASGTWGQSISAEILRKDLGEW